MKKTFPLLIEGRHPDRVRDALKHELNKYMARERKRALPPETDFWGFDCRFGASQETAETTHPAELNRMIDQLAQGGATQCYVELLAKPVRRQWVARESDTTGEAAADATGDAPAQSSDDADTDDHPAA